MEKLSSGYRINRAADDAAGLAISEKMRGQIGGLAQAQRNAQDGISLVQTAEGALTEVHSMLQRVRDLKVQYDNGTLDADDARRSPSEVLEITKEVTTIVDRHEVQRHGAVRQRASRSRSAPTRARRSPSLRDLSLAIGASGVTGGLDEFTALGRCHGATSQRRCRPVTCRASRSSTRRSRTSPACVPTTARCRTASSTVWPTWRPTRRT